MQYDKMTFAMVVSGPNQIRMDNCMRVKISYNNSLECWASTEEVTN